MKTSIIYLMLLLILFQYVVFIPSVSAVTNDEIDISPESFTISGDVGDTFVSPLTLKNNNETDNVTVTFSSDITGMHINPDTILIEANSTNTTTIVYIFLHKIVDGLITFEWNVLELNILLEYEDETKKDEEEFNVHFFPSTPKSGESIAVYFTGNNSMITARGFIASNGYVHLLNISNGFGFLTIKKEAHGSAVMHLFSEEFENNHLIKQFTIQKGTGRSFVISVRSTAKIGDDVTATVTYDGFEHSGASVSVESPEGEVSQYVTDSKGRVLFQVNQVGRYRITASYEGQMAVEVVNVDYSLLPLALAEDIEEHPINIGDVVTIVTEEGANIEVYIDGDLVGNYVASVDGFIPLHISRGGRYLVEGRKPLKRGSFTFSVPPGARISVLYADTKLPVTTIQKDTKYIIEVYNDKGMPLSEADHIWISGPLGTREFLPLIEGSGMWQPFVTGNHVLYLDKTASTSGATQQIVVSTPESLLSTGVIAVVIVIVAFFAILFTYAKKKKLSFDALLRSIPLMFKKNKKKVELPFG